MIDVASTIRVCSFELSVFVAHGTRRRKLRCFSTACRLCLSLHLHLDHRWHHLRSAGLDRERGYEETEGGDEGECHPHSLSQNTPKAYKLLRQDKGFHLTSNGLSVKTNRVKQSREDEIVRKERDWLRFRLILELTKSFLEILQTNAQASWNRSGDIMKKHKGAFTFNAGKGNEASTSSK